MGWLLWFLKFIIAPLSGLIIVAGIGGMLLPEKHRASRTVTLRADRDAVWRAIRNYESASQWRRSLQRVERTITADGPIWVEIDRNGDRIAYETTEEKEGHRLVRTIASKDLPFGGRWTLELADAAAGCALTITEDGEVYNPFFRVISRFVIGHHATIDNYISELRAHVESKAS